MTPSVFLCSLTFFKGKLTRAQLSYHGFVFVGQRCDSGLPVRSSSSSAVRSPSFVLPSLRAAAAKHLGLSGPRLRRRRRRRPGVRGWEEELEIASGGGGASCQLFSSLLPPSFADVDVPFQILDRQRWTDTLGDRCSGLSRRQ